MCRRPFAACAVVDAGRREGLTAQITGTNVLHKCTRLACMSHPGGCIRAVQTQQAYSYL